MLVVSLMRGSLRLCLNQVSTLSNFSMFVESTTRGSKTFSPCA